MNRNIIPYTYLVGSFVLPLVVLAHGGVDDGDEDVPLANPSMDERKKVAIGLALLTLLVIIGWVIIKKKNALPPNTGN